MGMSEKNDGGPAFPSPYEDESYLDWVASSGPHAPPSPGMSLRDWFAGQALASLSAHRPIPFRGINLQVHDDKIFEWCNQVSATAWRLADAMLEERKE